jgi:hypothetical protein
MLLVGYVSVLQSQNTAATCCNGGQSQQSKRSNTETHHRTSHLNCAAPRGPATKFYRLSSRLISALQQGEQPDIDHLVDHSFGLYLVAFAPQQEFALWRLRLHRHKAANNHCPWSTRCAHLINSILSSVLFMMSVSMKNRLTVGMHDQRYRF